MIRLRQPNSRERGCGMFEPIRKWISSYKFHAKAYAKCKRKIANPVHYRTGEPLKPGTIKQYEERYKNHLYWLRREKRWFHEKSLYPEILRATRRLKKAEEGVDRIEQKFGHYDLIEQRHRRQTLKNKFQVIQGGRRMTFREAAEYRMKNQRGAL